MKMSKANGYYAIEDTATVPVDVAMDSLREASIKHIVWLAPVDIALATFAGNFGVTFEHLPEVPLRYARRRRDGELLVVGDRDALAQFAVEE